MMNSTAAATKLWYLSQIKIFADMTPPEIEKIAQVTHMSAIPKYRSIYLPGDPANSIYFLKKGRVRISKLSQDGKQITLAVLEPGDIFGEMALIDAGARDTIAETQEETLLCLIPKADFEALLKKSTNVSLRVTKVIGLRLRTVENQIENLVFRSAPARLAHLLLQLAEDHGKQVPNGLLIGVAFTHQNIADLINVTRTTVTELLTQFRNDKLITTIKRRIMLLDRERLGQMADQCLSRAR